MSTHFQAFYRLKGAGETVVLVPGLTRTKDHWLDFFDLMASDYQVLIFDPRGLGANPMSPALVSSVESYAADLIRLLDQLGLQKVHIMGVSLGGMIALACARDYPSRVHSISVVNTSIGTRSRLTLRGYLGVWASIFTLSKRKLTERITGMVLGSTPDADRKRKIVDRLYEIEKQRKIRLVSFLGQIFAALRFRPLTSLLKIEVPTLVVKGSQDQFVPPLNSDDVAKWVPGAQLVSMATAGHEPMFDEPHELKRVLTQWIEKTIQNRARQNERRPL